MTTVEFAGGASGQGCDPSWCVHHPAPGPDCPSWCTEHACSDEVDAELAHTRVVQVGEVYVEMVWTRGEVDGEGQPQGPTIHVDHYRWVSGQTARDFARAILDAVDLAERG